MVCFPVPRGFGFVTFRDSRSCDQVLQDRPHIIDGREVDPKTAVPRQDMDSPRLPRDIKRKPRSTSFTHVRLEGKKMDTLPLTYACLQHIRKCFVGGLPTTVTQEILHHYFSQFGPVEEAVIIHDKQTRLPRGFGFITFADSPTADRVVKVHYHDFFGKMVSVASLVFLSVAVMVVMFNQVEVKRAEPKVDMSPSRYDRRGHSYGASFPLARS
jgi:RNA-binding protein Musashi